MPELVHDCGKKVRFPSGTEGKKGRCPHCGGRLIVPEGDAYQQHKIKLDPPPNWQSYLDYLNDRTGPPREAIMPSKLMLAAEADEKWERQASRVPSKFLCPSCKNRLMVDEILCTKCGLDLRTGKLLGGSAQVNPKGMTYLRKIPWLREARRKLKEDGDVLQAPAKDAEPEAPSRSANLRAKAPKPRKKRRF